MAGCDIRGYLVGVLIMRGSYYLGVFLGATDFLHPACGVGEGGGPV